MAEKCLKMNSDDFWNWWSKTSPKYDPRYKDVMPSGEPGKKSGNNKSGKKRTKIFPKATVWNWHEL